MADEESDAASLDHLPQDLRAWAVAQGWKSLRPVQAKAWDWFQANDPAANDLY